MSKKNVIQIKAEAIIEPQLIECPECGSIQGALVYQKAWHPFQTYIHRCTECEYMITESDWQCVEPSSLRSLLYRLKQN
jgi:hypothetical protein